MNESELWKKMKERLRLDMLSRVENKIESGWPDVFYTHNKKSGWIELKVERKFPSRIKFQKAQPNWLHDYAKIGTCYVMLYVEIDNLIYIWDGKDARELNKDGGPSGIKPLLWFTCDREGFDYMYIKLFI